MSAVIKQEDLEVQAMRQELDDLVKNYDEYFEYSDDHRVWEKGIAQRKRIAHLKAELAKLGEAA
jgi:hypothetical protein